MGFLRKEKTSKYMYADKKEQLLRMNRALIIGYCIYYIFIGISAFNQAVGGQYHKGTCYSVGLIAFLSLAILIIQLKRKPASERLRYTSAMLLLLNACLVTMAFNETYLIYLGVTPLLGCVIYYDGRFTKMTSIGYFVAIFIATLLRHILYPAGTQVTGTSNASQGIALIMLLGIIYLAEVIGEDFQNDMLGEIDEEKEHVRSMLEDVLAVAAQVRSNSEEAVSVMNDLSNSTDSITSAVQGIASSTQMTAENIMEQTVMTQDIQSSIEDTLTASDHMVKIAEQSEKLNQDSMKKVTELKEKAATIAETNENVANMMQNLQEKANSVKSIADTIFSISSQTNLLALNASIESARAGEAGRGFAVVADEIRELAEKTRSETENIATILNELAEYANNATNAVSESTAESAAQDELITLVADNFTEMSQNTDALTTDIEKVDKMLNMLSDTNRKIVDNITQISSTTQEVTASSQEAENLSEHNLSNADSTKEKLDAILAEAMKLDKYNTPAED